MSESWVLNRILQMRQVRLREGEWLLKDTQLISDRAKLEPRSQPASGLLRPEVSALNSSWTSVYLTSKSTVPFGSKTV